MAEIALTVGLNKLATMLSEETMLPTDEGPELFRIMQKLQHFQNHADIMEEKSLNIEMLVRELRDLVFEVEDIIDEFAFRSAYSQVNRTSAFCSYLTNLIINLATSFSTKSRCILKEAAVPFPASSTHVSLMKIVDDFENITKVDERYKIKEERSSDYPALTSYRELYYNENNLVAIKEPSRKLLELLVAEDQNLRVIPVVGMAGSGKSTLVSMVYDDSTVMKHFECHAWITVSQTFRIDQFLRSLIQQLSREKHWVPLEVKLMGVPDLKKEIIYLLNHKRYLIILDDVWSIDDWNAVRSVFQNTYTGSRVILTTRNSQVAYMSNQDEHHIYNMQPLSEDESMALFLKRTFDDNGIPASLVEVSYSILKKCAGLPLAITAISGLVRSRYQTESISDRMIADGSFEAEMKHHLKSLYEILSLSYYDLPSYLKPCFLYMSIFPEDYSIECLRLIRLWVAEGLVQETPLLTPEEVGEIYLTELFERSLVQVAETTSDGRPKTCCIHDLIREIIITKSRDQDFVTVTNDYTHRMPRKLRRLSQQYSLINMQQKDEFEFGRLRSLFLFYMEEPLTKTSVPPLFSGGFKLLTVLDLQGSNLKKFPKAVVKLFNLRYLSLKLTMVHTIPNSIGKLQKLQTLDLKHTLVSELPVGILKLRNLRNLLVYRHEFEKYTDFPSKRGFSAPVDIQKLKTLQKLCSVEGGEERDDILKGLGSLTQLRRLGITKLCAKNCEALCHSIDLLKKLQALTLSSSKDEIIDLHFAADPPQSLQRLYLTGRLQSFPPWISNLQNLAKIFMKSSKLEDDPLVRLQDLPNVVHIELLQVYGGNTLTFKAGKFKKLKILGLHEFESLERVIIEKAAMCDLQRFVIQSCAFLKTVPSGIEYLCNLKVLDFVAMPDELISTVQKQPTEGKDCWKVHHIPVVNSIYKVNRSWATSRLNIDFPADQLASWKGDSVMSHIDTLDKK